MKNIIAEIEEMKIRFNHEIEEMKRRFNHEIDIFLQKFKEFSEQTQKNSKLIENSQQKNKDEKFVTIKKLCEKYPSFTIGGIRKHIFENAWNFEKECVVRSGRKILINMEKFESWVEKPKHKHQKYYHFSQKPFYVVK